MGYLLALSDACSENSLLATAISWVLRFWPTTFKVASVKVEFLTSGPIGKLPLAEWIAFGVFIPMVTPDWARYYREIRPDGTELVESVS